MADQQHSTATIISFTTGRRIDRGAFAASPAARKRQRKEFYEAVALVTYYDALCVVLWHDYSHGGGKLADYHAAMADRQEARNALAVFPAATRTQHAEKCRKIGGSASWRAEMYGAALDAERARLGIGRCS